MTSLFPFKAVVFDAFGTVVRPVPAQGPYHSLLSQVTDYRAARYAALTKNFDLAALAEHFSLPPVMPALEQALSNEVSALTLFEDVIPTISALQRQGVEVSICSNLAAAYGPGVRQLLPNIQHFVFSYEAGCVKPEPMIYRTVCNKLGRRPEDILFIGDTPKADVDGPRAFGMTAELLTRMAGDTLEACIERARSSRIACLSRP